MLAKLNERDLRTVYGNNLRKTADLCGKNIDELSTHEVKNKVRYRNLPQEEEWRMPILKEMLFARENNIPIEGLSRRDINHIIKYVFTA